MEFSDNKVLQAMRMHKQGNFPEIKSDLRNIEDVRKYMQLVKSVDGFKIDVPTGQSEYTRIKIAGNAKMMLGIKFLPAFDEDATRPRQDVLFSMSLNNSIIVRQSNLAFYQSNVNFNVATDEYFQMLRPLSGTDNYQLNFDNPADPIMLYLNIYWI